MRTFRKATSQKDIDYIVSTSNLLGIRNVFSISSKDEIKVPVYLEDSKEYHTGLSTLESEMFLLMKSDKEYCVMNGLLFIKAYNKNWSKCEIVIADILEDERLSIARGE